MKAIPLLMVLVGCVLFADSANLRGVEEIWVPDGWTAPVTTNTDGVRSYKPSVPSRLRQRQAGVVLNLGSVTINRNEESKGDVKLYALRVGDERVVVSPGNTVRLDGHRFRVVGENAKGLLILEDRQTKALWRFRKLLPAAPDIAQEE